MVELVSPRSRVLPKNESEALRLLADPDWRIRNMYSILNKQGQKVRFTPNQPQEQFLQTFARRNVILKARQLGFSTLWDLMELDQCIFLKNVRAAIVAHDKDSAQVIFRDKVKFAWENMDPMIHEMIHTVGDSKVEISWDNNSSLRVSTSVRSATLQWLHISEFGKICARYPDKAREVLTGSLPAVPDDGFVCIESTAEGQDGAFYEMATEAQRMRDQGILPTGKSFKFHFFSWHDNPEYRSDAPVVLEDKEIEYFDTLETKTGTVIGPDKRSWYVQTKKTVFGDDKQLMQQEYPSIPEEAFEQSMEGCYYTLQMAAARRDRRIGLVPWMPGIPVNTFWDIGSTDGTAVWMHQWVNGQDRFIRFFEGWGEPYAHYVSEMQRHGYVWGNHYLPHDAFHKRQGEYDNKSAAEMLEDLGLQHIEPVSVVAKKIIGIQQTRDKFPSAYFDATNCAPGIKHLDSYRKEWDPRRMCWKDEPLHDVHSEAADALRQWGQGFVPRTRFIRGRSAIPNNSYA